MTIRVDPSSGMAYGEWGQPLGFIDLKKVAAIALAPVTGGASIAAHAATGGFAKASTKCEKFKRKWAQAKAKGKTSQANRYKRRYEKWCGKADIKSARKEARAAKRAGTYTTAYDPTATEMDMFSTPMDPMAMDSMALPAPASSGMPTWLPIALGAAGLGLVAVVALK